MNSSKRMLNMFKTWMCDFGVLFKLKELDGGTEIQRYKGFGEMDAEQLWETTMNLETRIMLKVSLEDAAAADETFTVLMGDKVELRREFIEKNAKYVQNLDV